jgi:hypothetical protein
VGRRAARSVRGGFGRRLSTWFSTPVGLPCSHLQAQPYYDLYVPDSDEEFEPAPSTASGMTDVERPSASTLSTASDAATEQQAAAEVDSVAGVEAAGEAAAAAQETSNKSEETAVADLGEGSSRRAAAVQLPAVAAAAAAAAVQQQQQKGSKRGRDASIPASLPVAAA